MANKVPGAPLSKTGPKPKQKRKYTMSPEALAQRKSAPLKHGERSAIIQKYMSAGHSPLPELVGDEAVQEMRKELYVHYMNQALAEPAMVAMDTLSALRAEMDLEKARADRDGEVLSSKWLKAAKLANEIAQNLSKLKHGTHQTIEVKQVKDFFDVDSEAVIEVPGEEDGE